MTMASVFQDSIEALGLYQHVVFPTHRSGNILDLLISKIGEKVKVMTVNAGPYILDHGAIIATLNVKRVRPRQVVKTI